MAQSIGELYLELGLNADSYHRVLADVHNTAQRIGRQIEQHLTFNPTVNTQQLGQQFNAFKEQAQKAGTEAGKAFSSGFNEEAKKTGEQAGQAFGGGVSGGVKRTVKDAALELDKLKQKALESQTLLGKSQRIDTSDQQRQSAILQETIRHKQELAKVSKINFDTTQLQEAKKLLESIHANRLQKIEVDFVTRKKDLDDRANVQLQKQLEQQKAQSTQNSSYMERLRSSSVDSQASLGRAQKIDTSGLEKQSLLMREAIRHKAELEKVSKLGLDPSQLAEAQKLLRDIHSRRIQKIQLDVDIDRGKLDGLKDRLSGLGAGLGAGIGFSITNAITNAIGNAIQGTINAGIGAVGFSMDKAREFEAMASTLKFVSGNASEAALNMQFLRESSDTLGFSMSTLLPSFNSFMASTKGTVLEGTLARNVFYSIAEAARVMNISSENTKGAFVALSQIASKGVVSMEELRQQLGERIPNAVQVYARSLGLSQKEFYKLVESGQLGAESLAGFAAQLNKEMGSGVTGALQTSQSALDTMKASLENLGVKFGSAIEPAITAANRLANEVLKNLQQSGVFDQLNAEAREFGKYLEQNPEVVRSISSAVTELAEGAMTGLMQHSRELLGYLKENPRAIQDAVQSAKELAQGIGNVLGTTIRLVGELGKLDAELGKGFDRFDKNMDSFLNKIKEFYEWGTGLIEKLDNTSPFLKGKEAQPGIGGALTGTAASVTGNDKFVGAVLSILEAPSRQGRVDVAQVIANRVDNNYGGHGKSIRDQAFASGQFEPFFRDIAKNDIQDYRSAIAALQKKGYSAKQAAEALDQFFADINNAAMTGDSAKKVNNRAHFKGTTMYGNMGPGDFLRNRGENFFHYDGSDRGFRTGNISALFAGSGTQKMGPPDPTRSGSGNGRTPTGVDFNAKPPAPELVNPTIGNFPVTSAYGNRKNPTKGGTVFHDGMDLGTPMGTPVVAPMSGKIIRAGGSQDKTGEFGGYGKLVEIQMPGGKTAFFAHLSEVRAKVGQEVTAGQMIGKSGDSGDGTGAHLHVGASENGKSIDPRFLLNGKKIKDPVTGSTTGSDSVTQAQFMADAAKEAEKVASEARRKLEEANREVRDRITQERKQRDQNIQLQNQQQDANFETQIASAYDNPALKASLENQRSRTGKTRDIDAQLRKANDDLADLQDARSLKVSKGKLGGSLGGVDYSKAIKDQQTYIASLKDLREQIEAPVKAEWQGKLAVEMKDLGKQARDAGKAARSLSLQYESSGNPTIEYLAKLDGIKEAYESQRETAEANLKTLRQYQEVLKDNPELLRQNKTAIAQLESTLTQLNEGESRALDVAKAGFDKDEIQRRQQSNLEALSKLSERRNLFGNSESELLQGQIGLGKTLGRDTQDLERQSAFLGEELRYQNQLDSIKQLGIESKISEMDLARLNETARALSELNMDNIAAQFSDLREIVQGGLVDPMKDAFSGIISGSKSAGEAFTQMLQGMASNLASMAVNRLFMSLLGNLFSGGGGSGIGGLGIDLAQPVLNFKNGGYVPNFASGGGIFPDNRNYLDGSLFKGSNAIAQAVKREGAGAIVSVLNKGELVLTPMQARSWVAMQRQSQASINFGLGLDRIVDKGHVPNFRSGGFAAGSGGAATLRSGGNTVINIPVSVASDSPLDARRISEVVRSGVRDEIARQQRAGGQLYQN